MVALLVKKSPSLSRLHCFSPIVSSIQLKVYRDSPCSMRTNDEVKAMFEKWAIKHRKSYATPEEKEKRFEIFKDTLRYIDLHNTTGNPSWKAGLNHMSDLTIEEKCCGGSAGYRRRLIRRTRTCN